jgi:hypothetical protein
MDIKKLDERIVMSATHQQEAKPRIPEKDPANKYYSRAPRVRLSAEQMRDQALSVSALLRLKCMEEV